MLLSIAATEQNIIDLIKSTVPAVPFAINNSPANSTKQNTGASLVANVTLRFKKIVYEDIGRQNPNATCFSRLNIIHFDLRICIADLRFHQKAYLIAEHLINTLECKKILIAQNGVPILSSPVIIESFEFTDYTENNANHHAHIIFSSKYADTCVVPI
jgi:hypothetical protein